MTGLLRHLIMISIMGAGLPFPSALAQKSRPTAFIVSVDSLREEDDEPEVVFAFLEKTLKTRPDIKLIRAANDRNADAQCAAALKVAKACDIVMFTTIAASDHFLKLLLVFQEWSPTGVGRKDRRPDPVQMCRKPTLDPRWTACRESNHDTILDAFNAHLKVRHGTTGEANRS
jgi:hypothetical protein